MHACAEDSLTNRSYLHSMDPLNGSSTMAAGLAGGHLFGVVGNTDHHSGYPGSYGHGRMSTYARANSREAIFAAMRGRHTNALEGAEDRSRPPRIGHDGRFVGFELTARANPNNVTPATQGFAIRVRCHADTALVVGFGSDTRAIALKNLFAGSLTGNLDAIDTPTYRFHQALLPSEWQWQGTLLLGSLDEGETMYVHLTEAGGQSAWTSPTFVRTPG